MKTQSKISFCVTMACLALGLSTPSARAFALLGPFEPWMEYTNSLRQPGDIGGPMDINSGYRLNVPVVTYGFDQSFLDFFGTNGVAAVESAIQILNDLPPASQIVLTNFPFDSEHINYQASALGLMDLKSETLSLLLEQMGLASPTRYVFVLRQWDSVFIPSYWDLYSYQFSWPDWVYPDFIAQRNFDPQTLDASTYVNNIQYTAYIISQGNQNFLIPYQVNPFDNSFTAVADFPQSIVNYYTTGSGIFYSGLTFDDAGGLAYLLSTNNVNYETLLPGISGVGTNADAFVNGAWRPGVDKITFVRVALDPLVGEFFSPVTNQYTDTYVTNGVFMRQQLERVSSRPDFLFSAGNDSFRTGTTNWINNADLNNNPTGAGPGNIRPPVKIVFQKSGKYFCSAYPSTNQAVWSEDSVQDVTAGGGTYGSFDESTNLPIAYPAPQFGNVSMAVRVLLRHSNYSTTNFQSFEWQPISQAGTVFALQTSTNLSTWNTLFVVTNNGSVCTYQNVNANSPTRFYRLVPQ